MPSLTQPHLNTEREDLVRIASNGSTIDSAGSSQHVATPIGGQPPDVSSALRTESSHTSEQRESSTTASAPNLDRTAAEASGQAGPPTMSPGSSVHEEEDDDNSGDQESGEEEDDPYWARFEEDQSEASGEQLRDIERREKARDFVSAEDRRWSYNLDAQEDDDG